MEAIHVQQTETKCNILKSSSEKPRVVPEFDHEICKKPFALLTTQPISTILSFAVSVDQDQMSRDVRFYHGTTMPDLFSFFVS